MTVDEIIATGRYRDRRGREWHLCDKSPACSPCDRWHQHHPSTGIHADQMRLLIERDLHRDECPGLSACNGHPVPSVITPIAWGSRDFEVYAAWANTTSTFEQSLPAAMSAARALAVGE